MKIWPDRQMYQSTITDWQTRRFGFRFLQVKEIRKFEPHAFSLMPGDNASLSLQHMPRHCLLYSVPTNIPVINSRLTVGWIVDLEHDKFYSASYSLGNDGVWYRNSLISDKERVLVANKFAELL